MKDNKLIAEFMGIVYTKNSFEQYHVSWDWLWPVLIKCKESVDYCNEDNALAYYNIEDAMLSRLSIQDTYQAVVEFIKTREFTE